MTRQQKAFWYGISSVAIWSTVATAFKLSLAYLTPIQLLWIADLTAVFILFVLICITGRVRLLIRLSPRRIFFTLALGLLNPGIYYIVLLNAYRLLRAQEAQALNYTWAVTLAILSVPLLRQRLRFLDVIAIMVSYLGVVVIATHGHLLSLRFDAPVGVMLALVSTVIWALFWIINTRQTIDPVIGLFLNFTGAAPFITAVMIAFPGFPDIHLPSLIGGIYVGCFEIAIPFVLWLNALKLTDSAARIGALIFLSPVISLFFIRFIAKEPILPSTGIGLFLILSGCLFQQWLAARSHQTELA